MRRKKIRASIGVGLVMAAGLFAWAPAAVAARWIQVENQYFTVLSNATKKRTLAVLHELEKFRVTVQAVTVGRVPAGAPKIPIVFIGSRIEFLTTYSPGGGVVGYALPIKDRALLVIPVVDTSSTAMMIMRHEYVHALLRILDRDYPKWLEEGMAELLATTIIHEDTFDYGVSSDRRENVSVEGVSLDMIIQNLDDPHASDEYALYWVLAHFFLIGNDRHYVPKLEHYLAELGTGEEPTEAFERAFGMSVDELWQTEILDYTKQMPYFTLRWDPESMDTDFSISDAPEEKLSATLAFVSAQLGSPEAGEVSRPASKNLDGVWQKHRYEQDCVDDLVKISFSDDRKNMTLETDESSKTEIEVDTPQLRGFDVKRTGRWTIALVEKFPTGSDQTASKSSQELRLLSDNRFCLRQPDWHEKSCHPSYVRCSD